MPRPRSICNAQTLTEPWLRSQADREETAKFLETPAAAIKKPANTGFLIERAFSSTSEIGLGIFRQNGTRHAMQLQMSAMLEALEALAHISETRTGGGKIGGIYLRQIAKPTPLRAVTSTRDDGLHLVRRQVLAFVDQNQRALEAAATDIVQRLELDIRLFFHVFDGAGGAGIIQVQGFDIVADGAQPRIHLFLFRTRQEAVLFRQWRRRASGNDLVEATLNNSHFNRGRQCQYGFAGTGRAGERNQMHIRISEEIQRQGLMDIARRQTPGLLIHQLLARQIHQHHFFIVDFTHTPDKTFIVDNELVQEQRLTQTFARHEM